MTRVNGAAAFRALAVKIIPDYLSAGSEYNLSRYITNPQEMAHTSLIPASLVEMPKHPLWQVAAACEVDRLSSVTSHGQTV